MDKLNTIPKDILYKLILESTYLDKNLNETDIKRYLYILNKNYFNEHMKEIFYNFFNSDTENINDLDFQDFIKTTLNPFLNEFIIDYDIPYTSTDEEYIIHKIIVKYNSFYKNVLKK